MNQVIRLLLIIFGVSLLAKYLMEGFYVTCKCTDVGSAVTPSLTVGQTVYYTYQSKSLALCADQTLGTAMYVEGTVMSVDPQQNATVMWKKLSNAKCTFTRDGKATDWIAHWLGYPNDPDWNAGLKTTLPASQLSVTPLV